MGKNVMVIGNGGREHAICWKLSQSERVDRIFLAPNSHAIEQLEKVVGTELKVSDHKEITTFCHQNSIEIVIVGPEIPLAEGLANELHKNNIKCFGPTKNGARIEADKSWSKEFMKKYGIPTAESESFRDAQLAKEYVRSHPKALVIKASGLAAGKGVVVAETQTEACAAIDEMLTDKKFGESGSVIVVEELLEGEEVSLLAFTDGHTITPMIPAQDHKRIFDNDLGPNTGGMGAYCPCPLITSEQLHFAEKEVLKKALNGLKQENIHYVGVLYAGLMLTPNGVKVLEFNCRFGDPETQVVLAMLENDLLDVVEACVDGCLDKVLVRWKEGFAVGVVMASRGYPESSSKGQVITGLESNDPNHIAFHSGTAFKDGHYLTNGGRVLINVAIDRKLTVAAAKATKFCERVQFDGSQFRRDIAHKAFSSYILSSSAGVTYKESGVSIEAGDSFVGAIKPLVKETKRSGVIGTIGGFGGLFDAKEAGYNDPILVSGTDGVGTKLLIAQKCKNHSTIGIDLVAMCVNDVLAHGAEPLFFLDYFSCGHLDVDAAREVVAGIAEGCKQAGCSLVGGETAEMPDMYTGDDYDLAGFCVGAVERQEMIPRVETIIPGDVIIGLPSAGVHSNGFSLVRKVMKLAGKNYHDIAAFSADGKTFGEIFLRPTKIYVKTVLPAIKLGYVKAFAHITGGGLLENIPRVLNPNIKVVLDAHTWKIPEEFAWLATMGEISQTEMLRTFNCGIGGVLIVPSHVKEDVLKVIHETDPEASVIGSVQLNKSINQVQVIVENFPQAMGRIMRKNYKDLSGSLIRHKKRVGVLISGTGSNLQSLIEATRDEPDMGCEVSLVISNKENVFGVERARNANIPVVIIKHKEYPTREEFDEEMHRQLQAYGIDIVCLAGFMRILSDRFVSKWRGRLLNIHPSLLPLFKGLHAQRQALEAGVKVSGCTVHFVEPEMDSGAIIVQKTVPILPGDTEQTLQERIKTQAEQKAYPEALKLLAQGVIYLETNGKLAWK